MIKHSMNITKVIPLKSYFKVFDQKVWIYKENKNKQGVYCWNNLVTGKIYIGSGVDLWIRIGNYLSKSYLERQTLNNKSYIYRAILKYGYNSFSLHILKYCDVHELLKWEQYYIDLLNPQYNILKSAGSSLGFKHSPETKLKFKNRDMASLTRKGHTTIVLDKKNLSITKYNSFSEAAKNIGISRSGLIYCIGEGKLYKNRYLIIRFIKIPELILEFEDNNYKNLSRLEKLSKIYPKGPLPKEIYIVKVKKIGTSETLNFTSVRKAAKAIGMHHSYVTKCINENKFYKGKYYYVYKTLI